MAIGFNEIILSMLFLIPNTESQQVLQQHKVSFIEQQSKYINYSEAYNTYLNNIEKKRIEEERQKELARKAEQKKLQEIKKKELKTKEDKVERVNRGRTFTLTFYTDLPEENGGYTVTCEGKKLRAGMVASNYYKLGTKIKLDGYGTVTVSDRGSSRFDNPSRLDVLVPRKKGESSSQYLKRVNKMGKVEVKGKVIK